ncbi:glycosyltransferase [Sphaerospermopsis kisseleviana CS-549]|uniref:Glycosyltransferase n=1 Tax=Sphaerospermopsis kisseleviana CS-549 TaxID=3021783 RepID=A0ABT4ZLX7_9CYAN|nr:glycosyltransferase [Sphaerospermopsis kisseleviana]MDB9440382.1 glycosyltransferase [Sphaerospermopsis kisseleviana CS-549]BAZ80600.1 type 11 methyltransferase [Sphaerospermopsis kisseleviana NIES-73]
MENFKSNMQLNKTKLNSIVELLRCTKCNNPHLVIKPEYLECTNCSAKYSILNEVPIFLEQPESVRVMPVNHVSNQLPLEITNWLEKLDGYSLNIGAGATKAEITKCIEIEYAIWKNTDVVGDAHNLPFNDEVFDAVVCFNVFEHLHNPVLASREIFRVLKPGGKLILHTAFLQPLHEGPIHFYNATKYGIINWFSDFDIEICQVSENFNPAFTLGWLTSELLYSVKQQYGADIYNKLAKTTIKNWSEIWADPSKRNGLLWESMLNLEQSFQEKFSAGFELKARKPKDAASINVITSNSATFLENSCNGINTEFFQSKVTNEPTERDSLLDEKRLLAISRLQSAKVFEDMGHQPWKLIYNSEYEFCESPCVSVIITLYNYSDYIHECLESVSNSNLKNLPGNIEVLVVDDSSTDNSAKIVEEYLSNSNTPICLIKKYLNTGLADARNVGLKVARSSYVFILDADNWIYPNCLSVLYQKINAFNYAGVYGKIRRFDNITQQDFDVVSAKDWNVDNLIQDPYIDAMAMFNREILLKIGGYSTELVEYGWFGWEDYDLWLKLAHHGYSCKLVPEILSSYRLHSSSMINTTGKFIVNMSRYFNDKFSDIAQRNTQSDRLFGSWRNEVYAGRPQKIKPRLNLFQSQELDEAYKTIEAMRLSKFWKIRNKWFKLKQLLGLAKGNEVDI